jgi:uncharacterized lipoprotein YmbA
MPAVQTLDRPEVVTQILPNRLSIDESDRWGAPLAQLMRRTLAQDLTSRLPPGVFIFPDAPAPDTRMLVVTVLDAETDASGTVTLHAAWTLQSGQPARATLTQQATLKAALENRSAAAQTAALSRILGALADRIAASVVAR